MACLLASRPAVGWRLRIRENTEGDCQRGTKLHGRDGRSESPHVANVRTQEGENLAAGTSGLPLGCESPGPLGWPRPDGGVAWLHGLASAVGQKRRVRSDVHGAEKEGTGLVSAEEAWLWGLGGQVRGVLRRGKGKGAEGRRQAWRRPSEEGRRAEGRQAWRRPRGRSGRKAGRWRLLAAPTDAVTFSPTRLGRGAREAFSASGSPDEVFVGQEIEGRPHESQPES